MQYYHNSEGIKLKNTAVACGKFDGIHLGHQQLLNRVFSYRKKGLKSAIFSFDASIQKVMKDGLGFIYSSEERQLILEQMGLDYLAEYAFDKWLSSLKPEAFIRKILLEQLGAKVIVVGEDFQFGYERRGDVSLLEKLQDKYGYQLEIVEKCEDEFGKISSSRIRECIVQGQMLKAMTMLGRPYFVMGEVVHGRKLGRTIGMPTANLEVPDSKVLPPKGVYVSKNYVDNEIHYGITNIGMKPTVQGTRMGVETFLFDFDKDIYGKQMVVELLDFERPEQKFPDISALEKRMHQDAEYGRHFAENWEAENCRK